MVFELRVMNKKKKKKKKKKKEGLWVKNFLQKLKSCREGPANSTETRWE